MKKRLLAALLTGIVVTGVVGCGQETEDGVTQVTIGIREDLYPTSYIDEEGNPSGYDVEIAKLIDEALPEYEFVYDAVSQENLLMGLESGQYVAGFAGYFWNEEREQKYLFPEENIGGSIVGIITTKEHSDLTGFEDIVDQGLTVTPLGGTSGNYGVIKEYNEAHPDKQIELEVTDWKTDAEGFQWVLDGRYDVCVAENSRFEKIKEAIDTNDELVFIPVTAIKTWTLFNKEQTDLQQKYDTILKQLKEDGTLSTLSEEYFGTDILQYTEE
ncbi:MAG: transporter substrate-binding domain-containing protein [Lachnospiraceae bacterium]|nr:transporter substrate-binding domain-containing protein [Lachnospiraceae bacterium]